MPSIIYDVESAIEAGYRENPVSVLRKMGYTSAEITAGHEAIGVVKLDVEKVIFPLPSFITQDLEAPESTFTIYRKNQKIFL